MPTTFQDLSRQRLDFSKGPRGETIATLTVTLQDGSVRRFRESVTDRDLEDLGMAFAKAEAPGVAGLFDDIGKALGGAVKSVAGAAKKVASSKVFRTAAKGLALVAPAAGPMAPALMTVSGGMQVASKLASASVAAEAGAKEAARALGLSANRTASKLTGGNRRMKKIVMRYANDKRKKAKALAEKRAARKRKRAVFAAKLKKAIADVKRRKKAARAMAAYLRRGLKSKNPAAYFGTKKRRNSKIKRWQKAIGAKPTGIVDMQTRRYARNVKVSLPRPTRAKRRPKRKATRATKRRAAPAKRPNLITAARSGRLRSNRPGDVSLATLVKANETGRVFWVS